MIIPTYQTFEFTPQQVFHSPIDHLQEVVEKLFFLSPPRPGNRSLYTKNMTKFLVSDQVKK